MSLLSARRDVICQNLNFIAMTECDFSMFTWLDKMYGDVNDVDAGTAAIETRNILKLTISNITSVNQCYQ